MLSRVSGSLKRVEAPSGRSFMMMKMEILLVKTLENLDLSDDSFIPTVTFCK